MKKIILAAAVAAAVVISALAIFYSNRPWDPDDRALAHAIGYTRNEEVLIGSGIGLYLQENGGVTNPVIAQGNSRRLLEELFEEPKYLDLGLRSYLMAQRKCLCDPWLNAYSLIITNITKDGALFVIISNGPNGINEGGRGDDIVYRTVLR